MGAAALDSLAGRRSPTAVVAAEPPWGERPLAARAEAWGLEVHHFHRMGPAPAEQRPDLFADLDVAVCCCWTELLQPGALQAPAHGWLNLHPSRLPAWRGADPVGWQLLTAPSHIGCSVHRMTTGQDDGPLAAEGWAPVNAGDNRGDLLRRSGEELGRLAAELLAELARGAALPERPQAHEHATWCPPAGTVPMVDPRQMGADAGARVARAFSPHPGVAVATIPGEQRFALTEVGRRLTEHEVPGSVTGAHDKSARSTAHLYGEGEAVAIAFRDRWLHGLVRSLGGPAAPGTQEAAGEGAGSSQERGAVHLPLEEPESSTDQ